MNMKDKGPNDLEKNIFDLTRENHRLKMKNAKWEKEMEQLLKKHKQEMKTRWHLLITKKQYLSYWRPTIRNGTGKVNLKNLQGKRNNGRIYSSGNSTNDSYCYNDYF